MAAAAIPQSLGPARAGRLWCRMIFVALAIRLPSSRRGETIHLWLKLEHVIVTAL